MKGNSSNDPEPETSIEEKERSVLVCQTLTLNAQNGYNGPQTRKKYGGQRGAQPTLFPNSSCS
jgi:hypothetical protein